jgi:hypothetical protein
VGKSLEIGTKWKDVIKVPSALAKKLGLNNADRPKLTRGRDLLPTAQLRIAFSGVSQKQAATANDIHKGTVSYLRKAAAHAYLELQRVLLQKSAALMLSTSRATQLH